MLLQQAQLRFREPFVPLQPLKAREELSRSCTGAREESPGKLQSIAFLNGKLGVTSVVSVTEMNCHFGGKGEKVVRAHQATATWRAAPLASCKVSIPSGLLVYWRGVDRYRRGNTSRQITSTEGKGLRQRPHNPAYSPPAFSAIRNRTK